MSQPNPGEARKHLSGVDYSCAKDDLVRHACGVGTTRFFATFPIAPTTGRMP
ncbi:hypothetical protein [Saccharomonospora xinjiangensis]|uniref:hypothetical protein n=1 Tax=Saccharomonospora xinjiangensis TaxID=75294 RepID=UPI0035108690